MFACVGSSPTSCISFSRFFVSIFFLPNFKFYFFSNLFNMTNLPTDQYTIIHCPLHLKSENSIPLVFGSLSQLKTHVRNGDTSIDARLQPQNPMSNKVTLTNNTTNKLLLKIHLYTDSNNEFKYDATIVGQCMHYSLLKNHDS